MSNAIHQSDSLNLYGDRREFRLGSCGYDISSQRFDDLDRACVRFALKQRSGGIVGIDVGCGLGSPSIALALCGVRMILIDKLDLSKRFERLKEIIPDWPFEFLHQDIQGLKKNHLPTNLTFCYSQRCIQYLTFAEASELVALLAAHLKLNGRLFLSASGLRSELDKMYSVHDVPIENRFSRLAPDVAAWHGIHEPVCLYEESELVELVVSHGLQVVKTMTTPFGNVQGIFVKK